MWTYRLRLIKLCMENAVRGRKQSYHRERLNSGLIVNVPAQVIT